MDRGRLFVTIVDLPDGTLVLPPNPTVVRILRVAFGSGLVATAGVFVALAFVYPRFARFWPVWVLVLGGMAAFDWFVLKIVKPPPLKADAMELSYEYRFDRKRMSRADLSSIFRGQVQIQVRNRKLWNKGYIFVARDRSVGMSFGATVFTEEGMAELAQRLGVPLEGDFSKQVKDRLEQ